MLFCAYLDFVKTLQSFARKLRDAREDDEEVALIYNLMNDRIRLLNINRVG